MIKHKTRRGQANGNGDSAEAGWAIMFSRCTWTGLELTAVASVIPGMVFCVRESGRSSARLRGARIKLIVCKQAYLQLKRDLVHPARTQPCSRLAGMTLVPLRYLGKGAEADVGNQVDHGYSTVCASVTPFCSYVLYAFMKMLFQRTW